MDNVVTRIDPVVILVGRLPAFHCVSLYIGIKSAVIGAVYAVIRYETGPRRIIPLLASLHPCFVGIQHFLLAGENFGWS